MNVSIPVGFEPGRRSSVGAAPSADERQVATR